MESVFIYILFILCILNVVLATVKLEIQWKFGDYIKSMYEKAGSNEDRYNYISELMVTVVIIALPIKQQWYLENYMLYICIVMQLFVMKILLQQNKKIVMLVFEQYDCDIYDSYKKQTYLPKEPWKTTDMSLLTLPWIWDKIYRKYNN